jgi:hypothetical protein
LEYWKATTSLGAGLLLSILAYIYGVYSNNNNLSNAAVPLLWMLSPSFLVFLLLTILQNARNALEKILSRLKYLTDRTLITNVLAVIIIIIGLVLIVGGPYLMIRDVSVSTQIDQTNLVKSAVSAVDWIPGIPFYVGDLAKSSITVIGLVSWILGIDLLLVGLGVCVRHRLARFAALVIFGLAGFFQFVQFLLLGILGSPTSVIELCVDGVIVYCLLSRFDSADNALVRIVE